MHLVPPTLAQVSSPHSNKVIPVIFTFYKIFSEASALLLFVPSEISKWLQACLHSKLPQEAGDRAQAGRLGLNPRTLVKS